MGDEPHVPTPKGLKPAFIAGVLTPGGHKSPRNCKYCGKQIEPIKLADGTRTWRHR